MAGDPSAYTRIHGSQTDDDTSISPWICRPLLHSAPLLYNTRFPLSGSFFKIFIRHRPIFHFRLFSLVFSCFLTTHFTFLFYILCKTPFTVLYYKKYRRTKNGTATGLSVICFFMLIEFGKAALRGFSVKPREIQPGLIHGLHNDIKRDLAAV